MTDASRSTGHRFSATRMTFDGAVTAAFESLPTGILLISLDGTIQWANRAATELLGRERDELLCLRTSEIAPDGHMNPGATSWHDLALGHRARVSSSARVRMPDGERRDFRIEVARMIADGATVFAVVLSTNVDTHTATHALQRSLSLQQAMFEAAGDGFLVTDPEENAINCNGQFMAMWKLDPLQVATWDRVLRMASIRAQLLEPDAFEKELDQLVATPEAAAFHTLQLTDDRVFEMQGLPRFVEGRPVGRIFAFRDISARVKAEIALRHSQEQLLQAQKMEAVGRLAGGVAHDFNNLLTIITSYVHLIRMRRNTGTPLMEALAEIEKAADGAAELTRQLLAFSRKQILEPKVLDLNALLTEHSRMMRRLIGDDIELEMDLGSPLGRIRADRNQLQQVVLNLVVNARDAMSSGGHLRITTGNRVIVPGANGSPADATSGPHVMLAVTDDGIGMDATTISRVFEPFFTTKEAGRGTGLGLATVYGMVRQSGGFVAVESSLGSGTTFTLAFPHVDAELDRQSNAPEDVIADGTETILLVEDAVEVRRLTQTILEGRGYHVIAANDPLDALRHFEAHPTTVDLVLSDVMMPKMDGRRLTDSMRRVRPDVKVLLMSGFADTTAVSTSDASKRPEILSKPFTPDALARKVRMVIDGR